MGWLAAFHTVTIYSWSDLILWNTLLSSVRSTHPYPHRHQQSSTRYPSHAQRRESGTPYCPISSPRWYPSPLLSSWSSRWSEPPSAWLWLVGPIYVVPVPMYHSRWWSTYQDQSYHHSPRVGSTLTSMWSLSPKFVPTNILFYFVHVCRGSTPPTRTRGSPNPPPRWQAATGNHSQPPTLESSTSLSAGPPCSPSRGTSYPIWLTEPPPRSRCSPLTSSPRWEEISPPKLYASQIVSTMVPHSRWQ